MERRNEVLVAAFADALRDQRERAGLTQEALAERAELSARYISFLETRRRQPSLTTLLAISKGLGTSMVTLVDEVEGRYRDTADLSHTG